MKKIGLYLLLSFFLSEAFSQNSIDILHYRYKVTLNDINDIINCEAYIIGKFLRSGNELSLDLVQANAATGKGMTVDDVKGPGVTGFKQINDKLLITYQHPAITNDSFSLEISYHGVPADGFIISKNKFGDRSFFSDNWPNRAHNWIPCNDNPADKASVEFIVTAPSHYQVISNGVQIEETNLPDNKKMTHWKEDVPLPTKIMVIGAADFAVNYTGDINCVPVYSWVFPENKDKGFYDYAPARDILSFFMNYIGPYPYKKLANVQSKTIFGGMENASAIFYFENSVTGKQQDESLFAHEIVHQWFGDMATEKSFAHLWLSEGFATYLAHIYIESKYGVDSLNKEMQKDRGEVIAFAKQSSRPVVDSISPYMDLLNTNSYQKGSWVLHMLRRQLGDSVFHRIIRTYYDRFKGKNADTEDLRAIAEELSGQKLDLFFREWLYLPGVPQLKITWKWLAKEKKIQLNFIPIQPEEQFSFPLDLAINFASGKKMIKTLAVENKPKTLSWPVMEKPVIVIADPNTSLLTEVIIEELK